MHLVSWRMLPPAVAMFVIAGDATWKAASVMALNLLLTAGAPAISLSRVLAPITVSASARSMPSMLRSLPIFITKAGSMSLHFIRFTRSVPPAMIFTVSLRVLMMDSASSKSAGSRY